MGTERLRQLGNNTTTNAKTPVQVSSLGNRVPSRSAPGPTTVSPRNQMECMGVGRQLLRQLGNNSTATSRVPVQVSGLTGITAVAGGQLPQPRSQIQRHRLGLWQQHLRAAGNSSTTSLKVPVQVKNLTNVCVYRRRRERQPRLEIRLEMSGHGGTTTTANSATATRPITPRPWRSRPSQGSRGSVAVDPTASMPIVPRRSFRRGSKRSRVQLGNGISPATHRRTSRSALSTECAYPRPPATPTMAMACEATSTATGTTEQDA